MAEKEERIYVRKYGEDNPCDTCEDKNGDECDLCMKNYEWNASITRTEAIERMAKEIARQYDPRKPNKEEYEKVWKQELFPATKKYYLKQAECVLNALLRGK